MIKIRKKTNFTFLNLFNIFTISVIFPLLITLIVFAVFSYKNSQKNNEILLTQTVELYSENISDAFIKTKNFVNTIAVTDSNFSTLLTKADNLSAHIATHEINEKFKIFLKTHQFIDGLFIYSDKNNIHRYVLSEEYSYNIKDKLKEFVVKTAKTEKNRYRSDWAFINIDGRAYTYVIIGNEGTYVAAMIDLEKLTKTVSKNSNMKISVAMKKSPLSNKEWLEENNIELHPNDIIYKSGEKNSFFISQTNIKHTPYNLFMASEITSIFSFFGTGEGLLILISIFVSINVVVIYFICRRFFTKSFNHLADIIKPSANGISIDNTQFYVKDVRYVENKINELKIDSYEKELAHQNARLQYLNLQIRPHFFLNCLKTIYGMAETGRNEAIQEMILAVSNHLRYRFVNINTPIKIVDEINHIKNYIKIQELGLNCKIHVEYDVDKSLEDHKILPFIIQTFIENVIKHCKISFKDLVIIVSVKTILDNNNKYIDIGVFDNAGGFDVNKLSDLNKQTSSWKKENKNIGINNLKDRLLLHYGDASLTPTFAFYNSNGGAVSEVLLPYFLKRGDE